MDDIIHNRRDLTGRLEMTTIIPAFGGNYSYVYCGRVVDGGWDPVNEFVAIKIIKQVGTTDSTRRKRLREYSIWKSLYHPNIVPFLGYADDAMFGQFGAFISPWYGNGDAARYLEEFGDSLASFQRIRLWQGVAMGIAYLHQRQPPIIHGDLKPGNVLIDNEGTPKICDFGLSHIFLEEGHSGMTTTTEHTGTERYLAPELLVPEDSVIPTMASDIYALGCLGLPFIYNEIPYKHRKNKLQGKLGRDIKRGVPPALSATRSFFLERSWILLSRCWAFDPDTRPTASILLELLETPIPPSDSPLLGRILWFSCDSPVGEEFRWRDRARSLKEMCLVSRAWRAHASFFFNYSWTLISLCWKMNPCSHPPEISTLLERIRTPLPARNSGLLRELLWFSCDKMEEEDPHCRHRARDLKALCLVSRAWQAHAALTRPNPETPPRPASSSPSNRHIPLRDSPRLSRRSSTTSHYVSPNGYSASSQSWFETPLRRDNIRPRAPTGFPVRPPDPPKIEAFVRSCFRHLADAHGGLLRTSLRLFLHSKWWIHEIPFHDMELDQFTRRAGREFECYFCGIHHPTIHHVMDCVRKHINYHPPQQVLPDAFCARASY